MNKIIVEEENIKLLDSDDLITLTLSDKLDIFDVSKVKIDVIGSTSIEITYKNTNELKLDISCFLYPNVEASIYEINESNNLKIKYTYNLLENSKLIINKFYDVFNVKELDVINLNGKNASIIYNNKVIAKEAQKYNLIIYHNCPSSISRISNKGITILDGSIDFNVTSIVENNIKECILNQYNKIINLNNKKCSISPNLLIEEQDVIADHSALITSFDENELFYLKSRGIDEATATNLLIHGFLNEKSDEKITNIINKYWR
ncbi:MAG: SufD family Fe-S cluster assembly protein [Bacilli bacterium]|nr:SufD family Fe-S cluster assembly protein [Bacilli bacterium]